MKKNVIKRNSKKLKIRFLKESYIKQYGKEIYLIKDEFNNWIGTDLKGDEWNFLLGHIRNENIIEILENYQEV